ncbi:transposable element Tcb2 transposase [Trichonephila clavipes]|nr:transposable element Tcb2 transposase [Trichonephila clavipes]
MQVWKQWTDEHRTARKTGSRRRNVKKARRLTLAPHDELRFNLWAHDGRIRVRRYAGERCLPQCVFERHSGLTPGVMVWGPISYHGRSNLLQIKAQHMQLLPWPAYSPDMSPIEHVGDLVGRRLVHDPRPAASKDELLRHIHVIWNSLPQADIQALFDSIPRRIEALIAARVVATPSTDFGHLILFFCFENSVIYLY